MPFTIKKLNDRWRIVREDTGELVKSNGKPVDGNGHSTRDGAVWQLVAMKAAGAEKDKNRK